MRSWNFELSDSYDVIVVGSGAAGLLSAVVSARAGKSVLLLEKSSYLGGTSAISGGTLWIPQNHYMRERGLDDDRDSALSPARSVPAAGSSPTAMPARSTLTTMSSPGFTSSATPAPTRWEGGTPGPARRSDPA